MPNSGRCALAYLYAGLDVTNEDSGRQFSVVVHILLTPIIYAVSADGWQRSWCSDYLFCTIAIYVRAGRGSRPFRNDWAVDRSDDAPGGFGFTGVYVGGRRRFPSVVGAWSGWWEVKLSWRLRVGLSVICSRCGGRPGRRGRARHRQVVFRGERRERGGEPTGDDLPRPGASLRGEPALCSSGRYAGRPFGLLRCSSGAVAGMLSSRPAREFFPAPQVTVGRRSSVNSWTC